MQTSKSFSLTGIAPASTLAAMNDTTRETPFSPGAATVLLIAGVGAGFTVAMIFSFVHYGLAAAGSGISSLSKLGLLIGTTLFIVPTLLYSRMQKKNIQVVVRWKGVSWIVIATTIVLCIGLIVMTDALDKLISPSINAFLDRTIGVLSPELLSENILEKLSAEMKIHDWWSGLLLVLAAVGAAALCEETLIRGVFQQALESRMRAGVAIALSSVVFAMIHFNPWGGIQILMIAVVLGAVAWRTGSVIPTIVIHAMNNGIVLVSNNLDESVTAWYGSRASIEPPVLVAGAVLFIAGGIGLWHVTRNVQDVRASSPQ